MKVCKIINKTTRVSFFHHTKCAQRPVSCMCADSHYVRICQLCRPHTKGHLQPLTAAPVSWSSLRFNYAVTSSYFQIHDSFSPEQDEPLPQHYCAQAQVFLCRNLNSDLIWMTVVQEWWLFVSGLCCAYFRLHKTQTVKRLQHTKVALCFVLFVFYGFKNVETSLKLLQKENKRTLFKKKSSESSPDFTKA